MNTLSGSLKGCTSLINEEGSVLEISDRLELFVEPDWEDKERDSLAQHLLHLSRSTVMIGSLSLHYPSTACQNNPQKCHGYIIAKTLIHIIECAASYHCDHPNAPPPAGAPANTTEEDDDLSDLGLTRGAGYSGNLHIYRDERKEKKEGRGRGQESRLSPPRSGPLPHDHTDNAQQHHSAIQTAACSRTHDGPTRASAGAQTPDPHGVHERWC